MKTLQELEGDIIDSRDLIEAIEHWQGIIGDEEETKEDIETAKENLKELQGFCEPFVGYSDWEYGETLIAETYFTEYVEELVKDCGYIPSDIPAWIAIDWQETAENVAVDYMLDNDYYMRCV